MNILILSKLSGNLWAGPNNSVPAQIRALTEIDNCFWYNLNRVKRPEWTEDGLSCKNLEDYPSGRLSDLPKPFDKPDIAIVEEVYCFPFERIIKDLIRQDVPYIIIPRSTLTKQAQKNKRIKKIIGNTVWFNYMVRHSCAIQYLTEEEKRESEVQWPFKSKVIPNGVDIKTYYHQKKNHNEIRGLYIGRIDIYQKGFDILLRAIAEAKKALRENGFHLKVFGPDRENAISEIEKIISQYQIDDLISFHGAVFGNEKQEEMESADVFIMASRFEGLPMGLIEALSYGLPCVITQGTNMKEFVDKYDAGWTSGNDEHDLANALLLLCMQKKMINKKSDNAYNLSKVFSWRSISSDTHKWLVEILENHGSSGE